MFTQNPSHSWFQFGQICPIFLGLNQFIKSQTQTDVSAQDQRPVRASGTNVGTTIGVLNADYYGQVVGNTDVVDLCFNGGGARGSNERSHGSDHKVQLNVRIVQGFPSTDVNEYEFTIENEDHGTVIVDLTKDIRSVLKIFSISGGAVPFQLEFSHSFLSLDKIAGLPMIIRRKGKIIGKTTLFKRLL